MPTREQEGYLTASTTRRLQRALVDGPDVHRPAPWRELSEACRWPRWPPLAGQELPWLGGPTAVRVWLAAATADPEPDLGVPASGCWPTSEPEQLRVRRDEAPAPRGLVGIQAYPPKAYPDALDSRGWRLDAPASLAQWLTWRGAPLPPGSHELREPDEPDGPGLW